VDIGCDEYDPATLTGTLAVAIQMPYGTNVAAGFPLEFRALVNGKPMGTRWDFGDGAGVGNTPVCRHAYASSGWFDLSFTASNFSGAATARMGVCVLSGYTNYVSLTGSHDFPYTDWSTAATTIQAAVDALPFAGAVTLVGSGAYSNGSRTAPGTLPSRLVVTNPVIVRSADGPESTIIRGAKAPGGGNGSGAIRGVALINGARLEGFTVSGGATLSGSFVDEYLDCSGGGVWCKSAEEQVSGCIITSNSAYYNGGGCFKGRAQDCVIAQNSASDGGGAFYSELESCVLQENQGGYGGGAWASLVERCLVVSNRAAGGAGVDGGTVRNSLILWNRATTYGGGAWGGAHYNSTFVGNSASNVGGGAIGGQFLNCILYDNFSPTNGAENWHSSQFNLASLTYCCTKPLPPGTGNLTNNPQFADAPNGNFRPSPASVCIDRGVNTSVSESDQDYEGNPRVFNGTADIGAYEFTVNTALRVLLQGPYSTNTHAMGTNLHAQGLLPLTAPYRDDSQVATNLPTGITDWVLVQLLATGTWESVAAKSGFLRSDGYVLDETGTNRLRLECSPGAYYLSVKHRNHLAAMSAQPVAYTNSKVDYNFTGHSAMFHGGTNGAVRLEPATWGMIAGDADGDGRITAADRTICSNQLGKTGYLSGDLNLDGVVTETE